MKQLIVLLTSILFFSFIHINVYAQDASKIYVTNLNEALTLSKKTKQNIVLIFSAEWCIYCQKLKDDLPNIEELEPIIVCILDKDKEKKIARDFNVKSLPTSIMLNSDGKEVSRIVGYDKASYKKWLKTK